ncbi:MAG: vitamin K epoxide reductase family protein [Trebonia sp.]
MANAKARGKSRGQSTADIPLATPTIPARPVAEQKPVTQAAEAEPETAEDHAGEKLEQERTGPPTWLQITSLVLAVLGLVISVYETYAHYNGNHLLGCSSAAHSTFDCAAVITSSQSMVFNIFPVAVLGLAFYVFLTAIMTPWAWRMRRPEVHWLRLGSMIVGMGFVMYLIYAEVYQIQEVCEYCTGVHIVTFLLFCLTVLSAAAWGLRPSQK